MTSWRVGTGLARLPVAATLLIVACTVAALSLRVLFASAANADLFDLAASIERGSSPDAAYLADFVAGHSLDRASADCGDSFTRASLTVNLATLDAATAHGDLPLADPALKISTWAARRRLRCNPLDGNAWLHEAMLEARRSGASRAVVAALQRSYWTAPSEAWILGPRLVFATKLIAADATGFETEYQADLRRFVSFAGSDRVAAAYVDAAAHLRGEIRSLISAQADDRRKTIVAEIDRLGVDFAEDQKP